MKEKKEDSDRKLIDIRGRTWYIGFSLSEIPKPLRGRGAENLIRVYLNSLGTYDDSPEETYQDMIAVDPSTKNRVPVQVKSISLKRHGWEIRVDDVPLKKFTGFYLILLEHEPEDIILHIESGELRQLMDEIGKTKDGYHHKNRQGLYVPASLKDFEHYISPDRFKEAVFGERKGN